MMVSILRRCAATLAVLALVPLASACGQGGASAATTPRPHCPSALAAGYRHLADRVGAPVYCPGWMPSPLAGKISQSGIGSSGDAIPLVSRDHSYMISWNWAESDTGEVHVILRGYPGRTTIPTCVLTTSGGSQATIRAGHFGTAIVGLWRRSRAYVQSLRSVRCAFPVFLLGCFWLLVHLAANEFN